MTGSFYERLGRSLENDVALVIDRDFAGLAAVLSDAAPHSVVVLLELGDLGGAVGNRAVLCLAFGETVGALQRSARVGLGRGVNVGFAGFHESRLVKLAVGRH